AWTSSSSVNAPCSASHSATADSPSRTSSARRAALVIHADTLTPSSAAASMTFSWTSGSTVIASFGEGFPLGMPQLYYHGRSAEVPCPTGFWAPFRRPGRAAKFASGIRFDLHFLLGLSVGEGGLTDCSVGASPPVSSGIWPTSSIYLDPSTGPDASTH